MAIGRGSTELEQTTIEQKQPEQNSRKPEIQQTKQTPPKSQYTHMHEPEEATEPEQAKSREIEIPTTAEATPEVAKGEKEYNIEDLKKNPVALATVLATMHTQSEGKSEDEPKQKQKRSRQGTPAQLARSIAYMVQQLGENPKLQQSDITRVTKFYYAASQIFTGFTNSWFLSQMQEAFTAACKARGVKRRVPYFFVCLENILHLTLEEKAYIRTDEPLYSDSAIKDFMSQLRRSYERSGSDLAYHEWIKQNYHLS